MTTQIALERDVTSSRMAAWGAVFALTLCVATLIASEFMPVSLLTPIATDLHLTEGRAGQVISVSGIFAVLTSLLISAVIQDIDRRKVLLSLTLLMVASGLVTAFAPSFTILMIGRALIGVAIGGFWSMSAATVMRLVPDEQVPRALAFLNGGNALSTTIAAPLGSFLGQYIGWRGAFFCVVPLAAVTLGWQFLTLPSMPSARAPGALNVFRLMMRPQVPRGIAAVMLLFAGQFALFTYLRPFLETVTRVNVSTLSLILLILGGAGLLGTYLIGLLLKTRLHSLLVAIPVAMAGIAVGLVALGTSTPASTVLLAGWGLIGTAAPVAWWTWLSRTMPGEAEAGGGLMVAAIQLAITAGAAVGGVLYDSGGHQSAFAVSAAMLLGSALLAWSNREPATIHSPRGTPRRVHEHPSQARSRRQGTDRRASDRGANISLQPDRGRP
jgi:predicted MFS family arabinose efflux permease